MHCRNFTFKFDTFSSLALEVNPSSLKAKFEFGLVQETQCTLIEFNLPQNSTLVEIGYLLGQSEGLTAVDYMMILINQEFEIELVSDRSLKIQDIAGQRLFVFSVAPGNQAFLFFQDSQSLQVLIDYPILIHGESDDEFITNATLIHAQLFNKRLNSTPVILSGTPKKIIVPVK